MIKLRAMGLGDVCQVIALLGTFRDEVPSYGLLLWLRRLFVPIQALSMALPPAWQFTPAVFTATAHGRVLGVLGLSKDPDMASRWKIDHLVLAPDVSTYDVGAQLANYALSRYGAAGVQTFVAMVHARYEQALGLLKSCGFRALARQSTYHLLTAPSAEVPPVFISGIREATCADARSLKVLDDQTLPVDKRLFLERSVATFTRPFWRCALETMRGRFDKRWVVADPVRDLLLGSVRIASTDFHTYSVTLMASPGWPEGESDLLGFALERIAGQTGKARITVLAYHFQTERIAALEARGFERAEETELLVRDFWTPLTDKPGRGASPILLFSRKPSTAYAPGSRS